MSTEIRHGASQPNSVRRDHIYVQHDPDSSKILGIWGGNKSDVRKCFLPLAVKFPGDGQSYTVKPEDKHVGADTTTSVVTITLPDPDDIQDGHEVVIEDHGGNATANAITIATPGAETTEVASIAANDGIARLMWDAVNTNWKDVG